MRVQVCQPKSREPQHMQRRLTKTTYLDLYCNNEADLDLRKNKPKSKTENPTNIQDLTLSYILNHTSSKH